MSMDWLFNGDFGLAPTNWPGMILALLLSFACGQALAWVYILTHSGLSYLRSFVNALVLMPLIVALVMMVLANNLVTAFGMMAVFAIVRFRNMLRDTLDTVYVLTVLVVGMAAGTQKFSSALFGCATVCLALLYLWFTAFGSRHRYDIIVNLHWARSLKELPDLKRVLDRHSFRTQLGSQRSQEDREGTDLSYRLLLRDTNRVEDLVNELQRVVGVSRVTSMLAQDESEI